MKSFLSNQNIQQLENSLHEYNLDLSELILNFPHGILILSALGEIIFLNDQGKQILGIQNIDEVKSRFIHQFINIFDTNQQQLAPLSHPFGNGPNTLYLLKNQIFGIGPVSSRIPEKWIKLNGSSCLQKANDCCHMQYLYFDDITAQRSNTKVKSDWKKRYEKVTAESGQVVYEYNITNDYISWGGSIVTVLGYQDKEIQGSIDLWHKLIHPDDKKRVIRQLKNSIRKKIPFKSQYRIQHKNGYVLHIQETGILSNHPMHDQQIMIGMLQDITETKKAAEEIHKNNAHFQAAFNSTFKFIGLMKPDGLIIEFNQFSLKHMQKDPSDVVNKYFWEVLDGLLPLKDMEKMKLAFKKASKGEFIRYNIHLNNSDGELGVIDFSLTPVFNEGKSDIIMLISEGIDITELSRQAEMARIFESAFMKSTNGVAIADARKPDHPLIMVNDAFEKLTEYTSDEILGRNCRFLQGKDRKQPNLKLIRNALKTGQECRTEVVNYTKSGKKFWNELYLAPVYNEDGQVTHFLGIQNNISERKKQQEELENYRVSLEEMVMYRTKELKVAVEKAESANKAKSKFLANISHEIRTPLNAIIGFSDILISSDVNEKQKSQLHSIRSSGRSLLNIINDILDFSKIEAGKMAIKKEPVNIDLVINEIENIFAEKALNKGINFYVEKEKKIPTYLLLDDVRLQQILVNLISNAVKFTHQGHVILSIDTKNRKKDKLDLIFKVEDTGIGIPGKDLLEIFEPFYQPLNQKESIYGGTGLGLPICKSMTEAMGGRISVKSIEDKGSVFEVSFNQVKISQDDLSIDNMGNSLYTPIKFGPATLLIVDDKKENRQLLVDLLGNPEITIYEADNGEKAFQLAKEHMPDLILMDLRMPVLNGYEATQLIRKTITNKYIPIIGISASLKIVMDEHQDSSIFDDFITKPLNIPLFIDIMKKYLKFSSTVNEPDFHSLFNTQNFPKESERKKIEELILLLEKDFSPIHKRITRTKLIGEIHEFGEKLLYASKSFNFISLEELANKIIISAEQFETEQLMKTLDLFPSIINKLKSYLKEE